MTAKEFKTEKRGGSPTAVTGWCLLAGYLLAVVVFVIAAVSQ